MAKKRAVCPTRRQKEIIQQHRLHPDNWLVKGEHEEVLYLVSRNSNRIRRISTKGSE